MCCLSVFRYLLNEAATQHYIICFEGKMTQTANGPRRALFGDLPGGFIVGYVPRHVAKATEEIGRLMTACNAFADHLFRLEWKR